MSYMKSSNISNPFNSNNKQPMKSSFVTQLDLQRNERLANMQYSRKQMSHSTFLGEEELRGTATQRFLKHIEAPRNSETLIRARSLKNLADPNPIPDTDKNTPDQLADNLMRLKTEEIMFKYKTKIGCMLREIGATGSELERFTSLTRTDDILSFLSEKIRQWITTAQLKESSLERANSLERETVFGQSEELADLKRKLEEKETGDRLIKSKLRQASAQMGQMLDKIGLKQKELSAKVTEVYQQKAIIKQQERLIQHLQETCQTLQKESRELAGELGSVAWEQRVRVIERENQQLREEIHQLQEELEQGRQRQRQLQGLNQQTGEELARWRQRFEDAPETESKPRLSQTKTHNDLGNSDKLRKKSTMSAKGVVREQKCYSNSETKEIERLKEKIAELQIQNKQLILNCTILRERFQQTLQAAVVGQKTEQLGTGIDQTKVQFFKEQSVDLYQIQLETHYKRKMEQAAGEWKQKLYQIVYKYQDQFEELKKQIDILTKEKEILEKRILILANEKYSVENKLIEKDRQIYRLGNSEKSASSISHPPDHPLQDIQVESMLDSEMEQSEKQKMETVEQQSGEDLQKRTGPASNTENDSV